MRKFAIKLTKGNDAKIVSTHDTKEVALEKGNLVHDQLSSSAGTVSCISADFDVDGNMIGDKYEMYETWI